MKEILKKYFGNHIKFGGYKDRSCCLECSGLTSRMYYYGYDFNSYRNAINYMLNDLAYSLREEERHGKGYPWNTEHAHKMSTYSRLRKTGEKAVKNYAKDVLELASAFGLSADAYDICQAQTDREVLDVLCEGQPEKRKTLEDAFEGVSNENVFDREEM